jgi:hypothetical protein
MPSYLDFDSTKSFRDKILSRTLQRPNGPQTFTSTNYEISNLTDYANIAGGDVLLKRDEELKQTKSINIYKPDDFEEKNLEVLPRTANLKLYPYFQTTNNHTLIGILDNSDSTLNESALYKFAVSNILKSPDGLVKTRVSQDIAASLNTATVSVGRQRTIVKQNYSITDNPNNKNRVPNFIGVVEGTDTYETYIPGDYLTNPNNPFTTGQPTITGRVIQDATGVLGSMLGLEHPLTIPVKPSDTFYLYMGDFQKESLINNLSYNLYAPDYSSTAMGLSRTGGLNIAGSLAQDILRIAGLGSPPSMAYIGDDRGSSVKYAMSDFNDRPVRSPYYLSLLFDPIQTKLLQRNYNLNEGGRIGGNLEWLSYNSRKYNKLGVNNKQWGSQQSEYDVLDSTNFKFRDDSILGKTQDILNTLPNTGGSARSHVANSIDQTSRIFKDGDVYMARGSAVQYTDQYGALKGVEFCRTWTKDRPYYSYSDLMPLAANENDIIQKKYIPTSTPYRRTNIRRMDGSVMSTPWNLNIGPISDGNKGFQGSTNIFEKTKGSGDFYAKKYMLSIENLAWKTSNLPGFTIQDLPFSERGPNGGRVMWFPPYDLKVSEQNSASWEKNTFLGRPEPVYTYQNTERNGTLSFKVVVDHPSILNVLVREYFKNIPDNEADNYINAYFAGCQDIDFYTLIRTYTTLDPGDIGLIKAFLNKGGDPKTVTEWKKESTDPVTQIDPTVEPVKITPETVTLKANLNYPNDIPKPKGDNKLTSNMLYSNIFNIISNPTFKSEGDDSLTKAANKIITDKDKNDVNHLFGTDVDTVIADQTNKINIAVTTLNEEIDASVSNYNEFDTKVKKLKSDISGGTVNDKTITITIESSTSVVATNDYNLLLSIRRTNSVYQEILQNIASSQTSYTDKWPDLVATSSPTGDIFTTPDVTYTFSELGYTDKQGSVVFKTVNHGPHSTNKKTGDDCIDQKYNDISLRVVAPDSYGCRKTEVNWSYDAIPTNTPATNGTTNNTPGSNGLKPKTRIVPGKGVPAKPPIVKPPIDAMKHIIAKTLQESYYFKKIEESDPLVFQSLKEKLRYFHPGFHSTTPEGLNSRLTFLQQCLRPGDTIPVKGITDPNDMNARNTTFGPPPICVLRVGDFYHSKIVIRDMNITYDEGVWDLNPDGIGVQPMIATVSLQISFIGGQGLEAPVNRLQNALSSNFYGNTEMYDPRAIITNTMMGGTGTTEFTTTFLESFQLPKDEEPVPEPNNGDTKTQGHYIGINRPNQLFYGPLFDDLFKKTNAYVDGYQKMYNTLLTKYGSYIMNIFLSSKIRNLIEYDVWNDVAVSAQDQIELFGLFQNPNSLTSRLTQFETALTNTIQSISVTDFLNIFGLTTFLTEYQQQQVFDIIQPWILDMFFPDFFEDLNEDSTTKTFETSTRNPLVSLLDQLNFIVQYGQDAKIDGETVIGATLDPATFTSAGFYTFYEPYVKYIKDNQSSLLSIYFDSTIDFDSTTIPSNHLESIFSVILNDQIDEIVSLFNNTETNNSDTISIVDDTLRSFVKKPSELTFTITGSITQQDISNSVYEIISEDEITDQMLIDDIAKINLTKPIEAKLTLNYYKSI